MKKENGVGKGRKKEGIGLGQWMVGWGWDCRKDTVILVKMCFSLSPVNVL